MFSKFISRIWPGRQLDPSVTPPQQSSRKAAENTCPHCGHTKTVPPVGDAIGTVHRPQALKDLCLRVGQDLQKYGVIIHGGGGDDDILRQLKLPMRGACHGCQKPKLSLQVATHAGRTNAEKSNNEDFVIGWMPKAGQKNAPVRMAVAMADGVSSCLYPEWAAEAACWRSLQELLHRAGADQSSAPAALEQVETLAEYSFDAVLASLRSIRDEITAKASAYKPVGEFESTWNYRLQKGKLLQTTLMLAWVDQKNTLHIASVGDGGALLRKVGRRRGTLAKAGEILMNCDANTNDVQALGPNNPDFRKLTPDQRCAWLRIESRDFQDRRRCLLFTDGVGRCFAENPMELFSFVEKRTNRRANDLPLRCLEYLADAAHWPPQVSPDNLTLVIIDSGR